VTGSLAAAIATDTKPPEEKLSPGLPIAAGLAAKLPIGFERTFTPHSPDNALSFGAACAIQI
jgi:hypothetical protein